MRLPLFLWVVAVLALVLSGTEALEARKLLSRRRGKGCPQPGCGPKNAAKGPLDMGNSIWSSNAEKDFAKVVEDDDKSMEKAQKEQRDMEEDTAKEHLKGYDVPFLIHQSGQ